MATTGQPRVRRSLAELQDQYANGNKKPLEDVMRAWKGIKELPPDDPRSFFNLGGYHGEPFRGAGWGFGNNTFWGGYCNHGNVLFPTWHRAYLLKLEEAMRSIAGCETVTLPYWDETDSASLAGGIPWALTVETVELDGKPFPTRCGRSPSRSPSPTTCRQTMACTRKPAGMRPYDFPSPAWWAQTRQRRRPSSTTVNGHLHKACSC
jgi:hypothetical protein